MRICCRSTDFEVKSKWTQSLNPKLNNPQQSRMNKLNTVFQYRIPAQKVQTLNGEIQNLLKASIGMEKKILDNSRLFRKLP